MSKAPHLVDPFVRKAAAIPVDRPKTPVRHSKTGIIDGVLPGTGKPSAPQNLAPAKLIAPAPQPGRYVDGVVRQSRQANPAQPPAPQPAAVSQPQPQHKPHLQPHPMLQRKPQKAVMDVAPAKRPVGTAASLSSGSNSNRVQADTRASASRGGSPSGKQSAFPIKDRSRMPSPATRKRHSIMAIIGITSGVLLGFMSIFDIRLGYAVIAVYAIVVLFKKLPSRLTFMLVLAMFGGIIITQLIASDSGLSENMAVYAFLLLSVGVLSVGREVWRSERQQQEA